MNADDYCQLIKELEGIIPILTNHIGKSKLILNQLNVMSKAAYCYRFLFRV